MMKFHAITLILQVPVANGNGSYPFSADVPRNTRFLFSNKAVTPAKAIAKSVVRMIIMAPNQQFSLIHFTIDGF